MLILTFLLLKFFFPEITGAGKAKDELNDSNIQTDWSCTKNSNGISLYERWIRVSEELNVRERKGVFFVECSFLRVRTYLSEVHSVKEWMKSVTKTVELPSSSPDGSVVYIVFDLPWPFENRDLVANCRTYEYEDNRCIVKYIGINDHEHLNKKYAHIKNYSATWTIEKISSSRTKVTLNTFSEEPPMFPLWIQDPVLNKVFYNNLSRLKRNLSL